MKRQVTILPLKVAVAILKLPQALFWWPASLCHRLETKIAHREAEQHESN